MQKLIAEGLGDPPKIPQSVGGWRALSTPSQGTFRETQKVGDRFGVTVAQQAIGGVHCYIVTPKTLKPANHNRLLIGLHGGGWIMGAGDDGVGEAIVMAGLTGYKAIAIDYRLLPDHPFPAAMEDVMAVWKEVIKSWKPANVGVFGSSAGGGMALSLVQRVRKQALPLPGAIMSGTPWSDLSKTGDSYYANDGVDGVLKYDGFWEATAKLYANGRDLKDPLISPVYGDFTGFPPTVLVTGTRDIFLSNTVRVQHRLLEARVPVQLVVEEGQFHMAYYFAAFTSAPESLELYANIGRFFDAYLGH